MMPTADASRSLSDAADTLLIGVADRYYLQRDWAAALTLYRTVSERNPALAARSALALNLGHCAIELDDPDPLPACPPLDGPRAEMTLHDLRSGAYEMCRAGAHARAVRLLRFIAGACPLVGSVYGEGFLDGRTGAAAPATQPGFLVERMSDTAIDAAKRRHVGARVLLVVRRFYFNNPDRRHDMADNLHRSATRFGLDVREYNSHASIVAQELYPAALLDAIDDYRPDIIVYDDLFETGLSTATPVLGDQIAAVLELARRRHGARVVKALPDAWMVPAERVYRGLGTCVDLVHHCHPTILAHAAPAERARTFSFPFPYEIATPTVPVGGIPRASFVGTIFSFNFGRIVWWAECMARGLPIDFSPWLPSDLQTGGQQSDTDYANMLRGYRLSINLTRRATGAKMLIGRAIEVPLAGGVLVEEDSFDAAYFLQPGVHYAPFRTLDDLAETVGTLLEDEATCARLRADGHAWATRHFSGDLYWAGLLARLYD